MGGMKILVIGGGGREHALSWRIKQSPLVTEVFCAPGNGGTGEDVTNVGLSSHQDIIAFCQREAIALVVVGPETPLVEGLADRLSEAHVPVFGPSARAAQLEGSKGFTKDLCRKYNIPTAAYERFKDASGARAYIRKQGAPIVVKADGLAAGKGVVVAMTEAEALNAVDEMFDGRFGTAGASVVIEECLEGEEVSFFALTDGRDAIEFGSAQDHKRAFDGDTGPNTGGMGACSPAPVMTESLRAQVMGTIIHPTVAAMAHEGNPYQGVLFAGLMITKAGPKLIEYNARFGDPETQVLMMRLKSDPVPLLLACVQGGLEEVNIQLKPEAALCVVMAARGYPGDYKKGTVIGGLEKAGALPGIKIFHAGTRMKDDKVIATGGRVLGVTALGETFAQARDRAYTAVDALDWPEGFCRRDIGQRVVKRSA
jgi:phosphoribosylamine--glycine ligase